MLKKNPRKDIDLLFTDTDSLAYHIRGHDIYEIMKENRELFDLSDMPGDMYDKTNKKVIGKMKDEAKGIPITEFIGLRAKCYAFNIDGCKKKNIKCKGIKTSVAKRDLNMDKYKNTLFSRESESIVQNGIRSYKHNIYTESVSKTAISCTDDKVNVHEDNIRTYNFGYKHRS
jgi:hypothetical protein